MGVPFTTPAAEVSARFFKVDGVRSRRGQDIHFGTPAKRAHGEGWERGWVAVAGKGGAWPTA